MALATRRGAALAVACTVMLCPQPCRALHQDGPRAAADAVVAAAVEEAAARFDIPAELIAKVLQVESGGNPRAVSTKGAMGLMQLMPATWEMLRAQLGLGADPFAVRDNVLAGAGYLRELRDRFGESGALAAYNAGPARYVAYLSSGRPLPAETRGYLRRFAAMSSGREISPRPWQSSSLFPHPREVAEKPQMWPP